SMAAKVVAFATMSIGFFIALLDIQIVSASLRDIGGGLSAGADETTWVQTSYLIAEIIVIPLSGWLSRVMSTRWLFCVSAAGFTATSLLCGWAWDIQSMIVFRALQGFLRSSMIPTVCTTAFVWRSLTYAQPVVDLRALKSRNFSLGCFFSFVTGIGIFATIYLTPLFLGRVRGFSALQIGLAVFSTGVFQVLAIPIYSFCTRHIDLRWLMMVGLACFALGMW